MHEYGHLLYSGNSLADRRGHTIIISAMQRCGPKPGRIRCYNLFMVACKYA